MASALFVIPLWLDLTAVAIGAIQGAMFAARLTERRIDLLADVIDDATGAELETVSRALEVIRRGLRATQR